MKEIQGLTATKWLVVALLASFFFVGAALAQGQYPAFVGKFTLPYEVHWGGSVLPPGDYSITIKSTGTPMIAFVRTADGNAVTFVMNGSVETHSKGQNALLIKERQGHLIVHSLALNDLGVVLIYEPALAHEKPVVQEARNIQAVPVTSAKK